MLILLFSLLINSSLAMDETLQGLLNGIELKSYDQKSQCIAALIRSGRGTIGDFIKIIMPALEDFSGRENEINHWADVLKKHPELFGRPIESIASFFQKSPIFDFADSRTFEFVEIPQGIYRVGFSEAITQKMRKKLSRGLSFADRHADFRHEVYSSVWVSRFQITQALWVAVMADEIESNPSHFSKKRHCPESYQVVFTPSGQAIEMCPDHPVEGIEVTGSRPREKSLERFVAKLNEFILSQDPNHPYVYDLISGRNWECAIRAGTDTFYSSFINGDSLDYSPNKGGFSDHGWTSENAGGHTHACGTKLPNAWGIYDVIGNVEEMTAPPIYAYGDLRGGAWDKEAAWGNPAAGESAITSGVNRLGVIGARLGRVRRLRP